MKFIKTPLKDCFLIEPVKIDDSRGSFMLNYNKEEFDSYVGEKVNFVVENESMSKFGVIRGLHLQKSNYAQAKLVRVIKGKILDVIVDVRQQSETFGKIFTIELSEENNIQLYVPKGFLHGFATLKNNTIVNYKCDNYYNKESEDGVIYNDKDLKIDWNLKKEEIILSDKDKKLSSFNEFIKRKSFKRNY